MVLLFIWDFVADTVLGQIFDWVYGKIVEFLGEFFSMMKIDTAKQMIRDNQLNFTQIADRLGYNSIHYFSRQFKQITTMTPSEYATSIRLLSEKT